jgi:hypothetical protein
MRTLGLILTAVLVACSAGCSTLPQSMSVNQGEVKKIAWTKGTEAEAFRDQNGVCHTFSRDLKASLQALGNQVKACFSGALPEKLTNATQVKSVNVVWNKVPRANVAGVYAEATGLGTVKGKGGGWTSADRLFAVRGFFMYDGSTCHVVVPDQSDYVSTLGHEFKHCVDGYFHDNQGGWHDSADRD